MSKRSQSKCTKLLVLRVSEKRFQGMRITSQTRPAGIRPHACNIHVQDTDRGAPQPALQNWKMKQ